MAISHQDDGRYEIKFTALEQLVYAVRHWLRLHPAGFYSPFPDRWINNVYFDSYDYRAFEENLSGASSRSKVRYRWYGQSSYPAAGCLEVKQRRNCFGWKLQYPVDISLGAEGVCWRIVRDRIAGQLPEEAKSWLTSNPLPVIINRYYRQYLLSRCGKVRVTIDTRLGVWDQRFKAFPNVCTSGEQFNYMVIEFKCDRKDSHLVSNYLQGFPLRGSRHSKYVSGVASISSL